MSVMATWIVVRLCRLLVHEINRWVVCWACDWFVCVLRRSYVSTLDRSFNVAEHTSDGVGTFQTHNWCELQATRLVFVELGSHV